MFKTFTLNKIEKEQVSSTEGKMTFYLTDENGEERKVWGSTNLDVNLEPVSIKAQREREHPLIQCLFYTEVGETINIEFKQYNNVFERSEMNNPKKTVEDIAKQMQEKPMRVGELLKTTEIKTTEKIH